MKTYDEYINEDSGDSPLAKALWVVERAEEYGITHKAIERWKAKENILVDMQSTHDSEEIYSQLQATEEALIKAGEAAWRRIAGKQYQLNEKGLI
jgi:hypothetical protein